MSITKQQSGRREPNYGETLQIERINLIVAELGTSLRHFAGGNATPAMTAIQSAVGETIKAQLTDA